MIANCSRCDEPWTECECGRPFRGDPTVITPGYDPIVLPRPEPLTSERIQELFDAQVRDGERTIVERFNEQFYGNEVRVTDPNTGGQKGTKPERMDLLPWDTLKEVSKHYAKGAEKYDDRNWERGYDYHLSFAALLRHLSALPPAA